MTLNTFDPDAGSSGGKFKHYIFLRSLALLNSTPGTPKENKRNKIGSEISFFSPNKLVSNKSKIIEKVNEVSAGRS